MFHNVSGIEIMNLIICCNKVTKEVRMGYNVAVMERQIESLRDNVTQMKLKLVEFNHCHSKLKYVHKVHCEVL